MARLDAFEGDLRPVTILFADVRGFTRLSEVLPPEQLVAAINGCFEVLDAALAHYGGEVDKFLGDAVMATFGAPVAHEDDPRRAVLAALEMQAALRRYNVQLRKQLGCELEMRIGINTGVVLAGPIGSHRKREYTVMGDAVNVAARLEHAAPVGSVVIGESTRAHLGDAFRLRVRRSVRIRGKDAPVRSYVVLGQSTRTGRRCESERYFGRAEELEQARRVLEKLRDGRRAVLQVEGAMGIGKSSLAHAVRQGPAGGKRAWLNVACPPYGQDLPYTTLAGLLRGLLQRLERTHGQHALDRILASSSDGDGLDTSLAADVVRDLLVQSKTTFDRTSNLPAQLRKGLLARAAKLLLQAAAANRSLIICMDDCHWLDAASAAILDEAIGDLEEAPIGWLLLHRPGWTPPSSWPIDVHLTLAPLPRESSVELARSLLGASSTGAAVSFVVERAEGNPLYVVELCSAVAEDGDAVGPPLTSANVSPRYLTEHLRSLILSRIDALDETARRVVQVAAVLGHAFPSTLLRSVLGSGDWRAVLARLEEQGTFVRESRARGDGGGATWFWHFRHPLVQETVYASLLSATRSGLHRTAGEALEGMSDAAVADRLALLALHFGRSDDRERAVHYLCAAGDRARVLYLNREAIHYYEDALARLGNSGSDGQRRAEVLASLGSAFEVLAEDEAALDSLHAAIELETRVEVQADNWRLTAEIHRRRGTYASAHEDLTRAEACLAGSDQPRLLARVRIARSMLAMCRGAYAEARLLGAEAIALVADWPDAHLDRAAAYRAVGIAAAREEDLPVAREAFSRALEAARAAHDALQSATISLNLGTVLHLQGHSDEALERYHQALEFYERIGAKRGIALASNNLGDLLWRGGESNWEQASGHWHRARRLYEEIGDQRGLALALLNLGEAEVRLGLLETAEPQLRQARTLSDDLENREIRSFADRALTHLWAAREAA
jgi:class 3 adenylate cyclase/tetratricopeptide (TPR) repeat protein